MTSYTSNKSTVSSVPGTFSPGIQRLTSRTTFTLHVTSIVPSAEIRKTAMWLLLTKLSSHYQHLTPLQWHIVYSGVQKIGKLFLTQLILLNLSNVRFQNITKHTKFLNMWVRRVRLTLLTALNLLKFSPTLLPEEGSLPFLETQCFKSRLKK